MTEIIVAQDAPVLVAIDIAKARHEVLIAIPDKKRRRRLTVLNELADFNRLIATLRDYGCPVRVAFEATGNYHRALGYHLATAGFEVKLVSSVALKKFAKAILEFWPPFSLRWLTMLGKIISLMTSKRISSLSNAMVCVSIYWA